MRTVTLLILLAGSLMAYPNGYSYQGTFIVAPGQIIGTLNNFPALISQSVADWALASSGGKVQHTCTQSTNSLTIPADLIFTSDSAGATLLPGWEFESYNSSTGAVTLWVNAPSIASGTVIYAWYGNSSVTACQTIATATWNSRYLAVYHFTGSGPSLVDSTANKLNLTGHGSPTSAAGPVGSGGIGFNGTSQYATMSNSTAFSAYTAEVWVNPTSTTGNPFYKTMLGPSTNSQWLTLYGTNLGWPPSGVYAIGTITSQWTAITVTASGNSAALYVNGVSQATQSAGAAFSPASWGVGAYEGGYNFFNGSLAEVRIMTAAMSSAWVAAEYANESAPTSFWEFNATFPPTCSAGPQQVFRAGFPAQLSGSGASGDGSQLNYLWQQVWSAAAGVPLQRVRWSGQGTPTPTVTGLVAGPFDVQLTVLQADGRSATCAVDDGVVATDSNGTIILPANALGEAMQTLVGNQVQLGKNPWAFYDQAAQWDAALQIADYDLGPTPLGTPANYQPWWNTAATGTVSVVTGSAVITGSGTHFLSTICNSSGVATGLPLVVWPLTGRTVGGQPETGRRLLTVASCASDTQFTMSGPSYPVYWLSDYGTQSGLQYATGPGSGSYWGSNTDPANYYDHVQAYYELYFRSGLDMYLIAARNLADRWWTCPEIDRGYAFNSGDEFGQQYSRSNSISGLILRALDTSDGHASMWPGLHYVWNTTYYQMVTDFPGFDQWSSTGHTAGIDPRETGYTLAQLAYCALFDQDNTDLAPGGITYQQYCRNGIAIAFQSGVGGVFPQFLDPVQQGWLQWFEQKSTFDSGKAWTGATVTLTNGSTAVACTGANCNFAAGDFGLYSPDTGASCSPAGATCGYLPVLFTDGATFPANSSHTDAVAYCANGCTFIDSNHFTLDTPYQGTTATHGFAMGVSGGALQSGAYGLVGWGQEPFEMGILGWTFGLAGEAMACTSTGVPAGCDNATSALAYTYLLDTATWIQAYSWIPTQWGVSYYAGFPACGSSGLTAMQSMWCNTGASVENQEFMGDAFRGMMAAFRQGMPSLQTNIDNWYAAMWAKPGVGNPPVASPSGSYDTAFDATGCTVNSTYPTFTNCPNGYYLYSANTSQIELGEKVFGQFFGISNMASWPVARIGGLLPSHPVSIYVSARLADVSGATTYRVTVTEPTGVVDNPVACSSSPCMVTVNQGAGNPNIQVTFLSATGAVLHTGEPFAVTVN